VGEEISAPFAVQDDIYSQVKSAVLKFFGVNRSGNSESWFHGPSHLNDEIPGGWYDCGDYLKEGITQSYALAMLGLVAAVHQNRDEDRFAYNQNEMVNTDGIGDVLREARHGADYVLSAYQEDIASMKTSVGDFSDEHTIWVEPEFGELLTGARSGRNEVGANIIGRFAAGLAFTSALYRELDTSFASRALNAAVNMYEYAKNNIEEISTSPAYSGEPSAGDDVGLAAVALLYATGDSVYKYDLLENTALGSGAALNRGGWSAGLMAVDNMAPLHNASNTGWARTEVPLIWAFYQLILKDEETAASFGISSADRLSYYEDLLYDMVANLSFNGEGIHTIALPNPGILFTNSPALTTDMWGWMRIDQEWVANRYQWGNILDTYVYWDLARSAEGVEFPDAGVQDWKSEAVYEVLMRQMNYMLGMNPFDMSFIMGVGDKNPNHPHHRAANPEGANTMPGSYSYRIPTGAIWGGWLPSQDDFNENWDDYLHSEVCLDGAATALLPLSGLSRQIPEVSAEPVITLSSAASEWALIQVNLPETADFHIAYGTDSSDLNLESESEFGIRNGIYLNGLQESTTYYFQLIYTNAAGEERMYPESPLSFQTSAPAGEILVENMRLVDINEGGATLIFQTNEPLQEFSLHHSSVSNENFEEMILQEGLSSGRFHEMSISGYEAGEQVHIVLEVGDSLYRDSFSTRGLEEGLQVYSGSFSRSAVDDELSLVIANNGLESFDSLSLGVYFQGPDSISVEGQRVAYEDHLAFSLDVSMLYLATGFADMSSSADLSSRIGQIRPQVIAGSCSEGICLYKMNIDLGELTLTPAQRFRMDLFFNSRSVWPPYEDVMNTPPVAYPIRDIQGDYDAGDWSFSSQSEPDPFGGMPQVSRDFVDMNYYQMEPNPYITVFSGDRLVYGYSPDTEEMARSFRDYDLNVELDAPFVPGAITQLEESTDSLEISGRYSVAEGGVLCEVWVNGGAVVDLNSHIAEGEFSLQLPHVQGYRQLDVVFISGRDESCSAETGLDFEKISVQVNYTGNIIDTHIAEDDGIKNLNPHNFWKLYTGPVQVFNSRGEMVSRFHWIAGRDNEKILKNHLSAKGIFWIQVDSDLSTLQGVKNGHPLVVD
jgi:hypothetical protein